MLRCLRSNIDSFLRNWQANPQWATRWSVVTLAFFALTVYLGCFARRTEFEFFILAYGLFFGLYGWVITRSKLPVLQLVWLGLALRGVLLFALPHFSDDYLRFLWDGRLSAAGYHPFLHPPTYFIEQQISIPGITADLYDRLNSPAYHTVYPPVCQAVFAVSAWISPTNEWWGTFILKLFLWICECGTLVLLFRRKAATATQRFAPAVVYALNPLAVFEVVGNCHFEGAMVFFMIAGLYALEGHRRLRASAFWVLATASKLLPLLFLPALWRWLGGRKGLVFLAWFALFSFLAFAPLLAVIPQISSSLDLYFRKFQFNASIYYLIREIGYLKIGWDIGEQSGPWLGLATLLGVLVLAWRANPQKGIERLCEVMLFSLFIYLSFAAVVQPWYVCVPLAISLFTRFRFPIIWSGVVALSYSHYDDGHLLENYPLIALEYAVLWLFMIGEFYYRYTTKQEAPASDGPG
ncbi:MAG: DUF2029 domain-containing protein [Saprospiraceae bacterium]|nr:DUF2029 domain-containing protein [Saprospiraceae bacterium]